MNKNNKIEDSLNKIFFAHTLCKESNVEIFSSDKFKDALFIIFIASWYLIILNI